MKRFFFLLAFYLLTTFAWAQEPSQPYPQDPAAQIIDRAQADVWADKQVFFYVVLYNKNDEGYFDLYKGGPWQKIATQKVVFQGDSVKIPEPSVLTVEANDSEVQIYWNSFIGYQEGAVHLGYTYNRSTGKISMQWSD